MWRWSEKGCIRFQSEQNPASCFHDAQINPNVLRYCMHIPECPFQRTACVQRARTGTVIDKIDRFEQRWQQHAMQPTERGLAPPS